MSEAIFNDEYLEGVYIEYTQSVPPDFVKDRADWFSDFLSTEEGREYILGLEVIDVALIDTSLEDEIELKRNINEFGSVLDKAVIKDEISNMIIDTCRGNNCKGLN